MKSLANMEVSARRSGEDKMTHEQLLRFWLKAAVVAALTVFVVLMVVGSIHATQAIS